MGTTETKKETKSNSEYVSAPIDVEYGTTDPTEPKGNSKISCPSNPIILNHLGEN